MNSLSADQWVEYSSKFNTQLHGSYPVGGDSLREFLNNNHELVDSSYAWEDLRLDLDSQVKYEYVTYLLEKFSKTGNEKVRAGTFLEECSKLSSVSLHDFICILSEKMISRYRDNAPEESGKVEQITSYLLSQSISKGIDLPTVDTDSDQIHDPVSFCKRHLDLLLDLFPNANGSPKGASTPSKAATDQDEFDDLKTALMDLQLAYNFLQSKYENDRKSYLSRIEILNKTNKDLSEELLRYHSKLKEVERSSLTSHASQFMDCVSFSPSNHEPTGENASQSFIMIKKEFKRILTDNQRKYENELKQERELRMSLEERLRDLEKS